MDGGERQSSRPSAVFEPRPVGRRPPAAGRWLVVAVVLLVVVVAKPWSTGDRDAPPLVLPGASGVIGIPTARPSEAPTPVAANPADRAMATWCLGPLTWRTVSDETWRDRTVRVWRALRPAAARGPLDPSIELAPLAGVRVDAAGFCAPTSGQQAVTGPLVVRGWSLEGRGPRPLELEPAAGTGESDLGRVWAPPNAGDGERSAGWAPGVYVFEVTAGTGPALWWGFEIERAEAAMPGATDGPIVTAEPQTSTPPAGPAGG